MPNDFDSEHFTSYNSDTQALNLIKFLSISNLACHRKREHDMEPSQSLPLEEQRRIQTALWLNQSAKFLQQASQMLSFAADSLVSSSFSENNPILNHQSFLGIQEAELRTSSSDPHLSGKPELTSEERINSTESTPAVAG